MKEVQAKGIIGLILGVTSFLASGITELVIVLAFLIILDYVTGIISAIMSGKEFDPKQALLGAAKKALYSTVLVVAFLGDYIIYYFTTKLGYSLPVNGMLGVAVTIYLIGTEGFSIGQNWAVIGLPVPSFLVNFFGLIKDESGRLIKLTNKEGDENGTSNSN